MNGLSAGALSVIFLPATILSILENGPEPPRAMPAMLPTQGHCWHQLVLQAAPASAPQPSTCQQALPIHRATPPRLVCCC